MKGKNENHFVCFDIVFTKPIIWTKYDLKFRLWNEPRSEVGKGLKGYNKYVKASRSISGGTNYKWQHKASQMFQKNADDLKCVKDFKRLENGVSTTEQTKKKL
ncbi:MAG: hypothetical protein KDB74_13455 [Flavobacteriales bacterium]|nr:hypothetical protein [Flavobacteriales bacterium]